MELSIKQESFSSKLVRMISLSLILFSVVMVYSTIPKEGEFARAADEGQYFKYAQAVSKGGISQIPLLLQHYLNDKKEQFFPNPARTGHILITALWFKIFPNTFVSLAYFSLFCFILLLIISFHFSTKLFGPDTGHLSTALLASSPLLMASGRRALQDAHLNLFWILSVWLFLDFLIDRKKAKFIVFILVYSFTIMIKESSMLLSVFFLFFCVLSKYKYRQDMPNSYLAAILIGPFILVGVVYLFLLGGLNNILALIKFITGVHFPSVVTNSYSLFAMGPWYKYIIDYLLLAPIPTLLAIGYIFYILFSRQFEWKQIYFMSYSAIVFSILSSMKYTKIVRFIAPLDTVVSLFAVFALFELFRQKNKDFQLYCVLAGVIAVFFINYANFMQLFCQQNIYDPISYWLLVGKKIIPY